jgi:prepilin-type N-terminal cleavage/methylation domain-containing protein
MQNYGFSFIELLCALAIAGILCALTIPSLSHYIYSVQAKLTMQQIQQAVAYGRSLAIAHKQSISVYKNTDHMLVVAPNVQPLLFKLYMCAHCTLSLAQSGFESYKITIQPSGMTHQNGKFDYKSSKFSGFPQFNLYFNKALRIYMLSG